MKLTLVMVVHFGFVSLVTSGASLEIFYGNIVVSGDLVPVQCFMSNLYGIFS